MTKKSIPRELWETYRAMSVDVGREIPFHRITACMNQDQRVMIALCRTAKRIFKDKEFDIFIDSFAIPYFQEMGMAGWKRDVVTDLGFALAGRKHQRKKVGKALLTYKPPSIVEGKP